MTDSLFDWNFIEAGVKGRALGPGLGSIYRVILDSREAGDSDLFIPLVGENTDGNLYIEKALDGGCKHSFVSRTYYEGREELFNTYTEKYECSFYIVEDTLRALHQLASHYIDQFDDLKVIAITGSSGKTSTKEILGSIFRAYTDTLVTEGNYNSETGLPLTVFRLRDGHKYAVLEIGMSKPGEIKALVDIIHPDISIITNIGIAHIGFFDSRDGIAYEKKDAFANFKGSNIGIIPDWDDYHTTLKEGVNGEVISVSRSPDFIDKVEDLGFEGWEFYLEGNKVKLPYMGYYNLLNCYLAITCAKRVGIPNSTIAEGVSSVKPLFGRGEVLTGRNRVIRDCYNANPDSTLSSLSMLNTTPWKGKKVAILGSMLELGDSSYEEHIRVANKAIGYGFSSLILFGREYEKVYNGLKDKGRVFYIKDMTQLKEEVDRIIDEGSLVLLKASRGERLESITENLI